MTNMPSGLRLSWLPVLAVLAALLFAPAVEAQVKRELDPTLKPYEPNGAKLSGEIQVGASDTLKKLMDVWGGRFQGLHGAVKIGVTEIVSTHAVAAVAKGVHPIPEGAKIVALSYPLPPHRLEEIKKTMGVEPIEVPVAIDAIVLMVHHRNPLKGLTLAQVAELYAEGKAEAVGEWQHLGVEGKLKTVPVNLYGRDHSSGTFAAFRDMALNGAGQKKGVHQEPGSMSVVIEVGRDEAGLGYAATGFVVKSKNVRVVPLAKTADGPYVTPTNETVVNGEYPLVRKVYLYVIPEPNGQLDPIVKHFVHYILSRNGQAVVHEEGFFPLPSQIVEQALQKVEHGVQVRAAAAAMPDGR